MASDQQNISLKETFKVKVLKTIYQDKKTGYTVMVLRNLLPSGEQKFTGICNIPFIINEQDEMSIEGNWVMSKYGRQLKITHIAIDEPTTSEGILAYLSSGVLYGIGPAIAARIVERFGADTLKILDNNPERLEEVRGIGAKTTAKIKNSWKEKRAGAVVLMALCELGLSIAYATKCFKTFGTEAVIIVKKNPYKLTEVKGIGFIKADEIATNVLKFSKDHKYRVKAGIKYALEDAAKGGGHCFLLPEELERKAVDLLGVEKETVVFFMYGLVREEELIIQDNRYYLPEIYKAERYVESRLGDLSRTASVFSGEVKSAMSRLLGEDDNFAYLTEEQKTAVVKALASRISVITGGPGTGKSTTLRAVVGLLDHFGITYALCAPTGKASKRISEITGKEAKTIHRLLESRSDRGYSRNENNLLSEEYVIVDESSMIDLFLMSSLLRALDISRSKIVFIGDADQISPVGVGNVFKDIIRSGLFPTTRFSVIHRQAADSGIIRTAHEINRGQSLSFMSRDGAAVKYSSLDGTEFLLKYKMNASDVMFIEEDSPELVLQAIVEMVKQVMSTGVLIEELQVITPMKKGPIGVDSVNFAIQSLLNSEMTAENKIGGFYFGDKVMQLSNDYTKGVFNGDIGRIVDINKEDGSLSVLFDDRVVEYEGFEIDDLTIAYAITVHKAQGSEWPFVIMPIHTQHYIMLRRDLFYTGVTRSKQKLVLVGQRKAGWMAAKNNKEQKRNTNLFTKSNNGDTCCVAGTAEKLF